MLGMLFRLEGLLRLQQAVFMLGEKERRSYEIYSLFFRRSFILCDLSKIENNKKALTMEKVMMLTITYEDKSLYFRFRQQEDEFVLGCFAEKKLISI